MQSYPVSKGLGIRVENKGEKIDIFLYNIDILNIIKKKIYHVKGYLRGYRALLVSLTQRLPK